MQCVSKPARVMLSDCLSQRTAVYTKHTMTYLEIAHAGFPSDTSSGLEKSVVENGESPDILNADRPSLTAVKKNTMDRVVLHTLPLRERRMSRWCHKFRERCRGSRNSWWELFRITPLGMNNLPRYLKPLTDSNPSSQMMSVGTGSCRFWRTALNFEELHTVGSRFCRWEKNDKCWCQDQSYSHLSH